MNGLGANRPRVICLIPAHNEADRVGAAVSSIAGQVDTVVVVVDNCTDDTAGVARDHGALVCTSRGNVHKKAGALNQALARVLPLLAAADYVMVMDADSTVAATFVADALSSFAPDVGAVGGVFYGEPGSGLIGHLQRNEYQRYARDIARKRDRAMVLTGTATVFRAGVMAEVAAARTGGGVYDVKALTEDNEITLAVKTLGYRCISPRRCTVTTEVMPTWSALWKQRLRWQRGAIENLRHYGLTATTRPYILQQAGMLVSMLAMFLFFAQTALSLGAGWRWQPFWLAIGAIFVAERIVTVRRRGWRAMVLAAVLVPETAYDLFQQAVFVRCLCDIVRRKEAAWHHVAQREVSCV